MPIIVIESKDPATADLLANSFRNTAIGQGNGALLIKEVDGNPPAAQHLLEKIMAGGAFPVEPLTDAKKAKEIRKAVPTKAENIQWKKDPVVILVGKGYERLKDLEAACPGFEKKFGPVTKI